MIISKLEVKGFKSIKDMSLEFVEGKNIIVGQNNSGKSNIISAINLVIGEKYPPKRFDDKFYYKNSNNFSIILKLSKCNEFDRKYLENYNKKIGIYTLPNENEYLLKSTDELDELKFAVNWKRNDEISKMIENANHIYISLVSKRNEDTIYTLSIDIGDQKLYKLKYFASELLYSFITSVIIPTERNLKNELVLNNYSWYGKLIKNIWQNMSLENNTLLDEYNQKLTNVTNVIFESLTNELSQLVKDAIPYNKLEFKLIQDTKTDYYKGIKILLDDGYYSLLDDKGSGIKSLMIIELFKLYCKKYHTSSSCLIVEEPEIFLHPQARSVLSKKIDQFLVGNSNQTIITTHSEQFLSNFDIKQLTFISKENGESKKYKILDIDFTEKEFQKINIITKTENAEMFFADTVILVEGGEKYIIKKLFEIYKDELFLDYKNVSIIKVGGKSFFNIYKKMLEKLGKKVYIIGDYDNFREEVNEFLTQEDLNILNKLKGRNRGLKDYDKFSSEDKTELDNIFSALSRQNIFILHNGQLENYYHNSEIQKICQENRLSGKEIIAYYISTVINSNNLNQLLNIENDFEQYIQKIINNIEGACENNNNK